MPELSIDDYYTNSWISVDFTKIKSIDRKCSDTMNYNDFFNNYMLQNIPVILTSVTKDWHCSKSWTSHEGINFEELRHQIPNLQVPVADCSERYFNSHQKIEMRFHDFLDYWQHEPKEKLLYLKDWHLRKEMPSYDFYKVPKFFASDWLNEYLDDVNQDDYKFVYMGPKATWTSLHSDVFSSFSWSTNIIGQKKWIFLLPGQELLLKDSIGNLPFTIQEQELQERDIKYITILQNAGEAIFVPSGWFHQVHNVTNTISINHNWFNGTQIDSIWDALKTHLKQVEKEIEDCRDMESFDEQCQILLKASFGMNFSDFVNILKTIAEKSLNNSRSFEGYSYNQNHIQFDILRINLVLRKILESKIVLSKDVKHIIENVIEELKGD